MKGQKYDIGSIWRRWDPHIHAPGTVFNNLFGDEDDDSVWNEYLTKIEISTPIIQALGITDYFIIGKSYEKLNNYIKKGRLPHVQLVFINVELRLSIGSPKGCWLNIHLLISPSDENHVVEARKFLSQLTMDDVLDSSFKCDETDLMMLGRQYANKQGITNLDDKKALEYGCKQFKVNLDQFMSKWNKCRWIQNNSLIAVSAGSNDGVSSLQDTSSEVLRQKIEKFTHIFFTSNRKSSEYWMGNGKVNNAYLDQERERNNFPFFNK